MYFSLSSVVEPPAVTLIASGELDIFTAREVARELDLARVRGCRHAHLDVGAVSFVDASA